MYPITMNRPAKPRAMPVAAIIGVLMHVYRNDGSIGNAVCADAVKVTPNRASTARTNILIFIFFWTRLDLFPLGGVFGLL